MHTTVIVAATVACTLLSLAITAAVALAFYRVWHRCADCKQPMATWGITCAACLEKALRR